MDLAKLKAALEAAKVKAKTLIDSTLQAVNAEGRVLTEGEQGAITASEQAVAAAQQAYDLAVRSAALGAPAPAPVQPPTAPAPVQPPTPVAEAGPVAGAQPRVEGGHDNAQDRPWTAGSAGVAEFGMSVMRAFTGSGLDPRLIRSAASGLNEALGPDGGFALPVEHASSIEREMFETGALLSQVDAREITGNAIVYPVMRETSRVDGSRQGGVLGYWLDEAGDVTASKFQLAKMELKLKKVGALGYVTEELQEDAPAMGEELMRSFVDELQFQVEDAIFRGNGASKPLGFLSAPCLVTQAIEAGQTLAASAFLFDNVSKMWIRMRPRDRANAVWLCNPELEPWLDRMSIPSGTSVLEPRFVIYGPDGVLRIKGRPVIFTEYNSALGTVGDIALVNLKKYRLIRKAGGVKTSSSIHVRYVQGETALRAIYRVDGQMVPRSAITPFKGSATTSPVVVLDTRS
jgi:HK97 family phage major capsid protein